MSTLVVNAIENSSGETRFQPTSVTAQATTSGSAFDFTGLPSWVTKITISFGGVSLSGGDEVLVQIGDSGGIETSSYVSTSGIVNNAAASAVTNSTSGFIVRGAAAGSIITGTMTLTLVDTLDWVSSHSGKISTTATIGGAGSKTLSDTLTQVRITRSGTDTFDAGQVNIMYE